MSNSISCFCHVPCLQAWRMFEAFAVPNVERCLPDSENLVRLIKRWPKVDGVYVPGCRFVIKAVTNELFSNGNAAHAGVLEKRGGSKGGKGKSWKSRYFRIEEEGLVYYKTEPTSKKQLKSPLGTWPLAGWTLFSVRESVRKGKAGQYICLREETEPLWSADAATAMDQFEACKFMCAEDEQDEMKWISSVQAAQNVTTDSVEDVRRERLASVAALPATAAESAADDEQVASSDEEVVDSADTAALRMKKVDPHEATQLAKRISTVPEDVSVNLLSWIYCSCSTKLCPNLANSTLLPAVLPIVLTPASLLLCRRYYYCRPRPRKVQAHCRQEGHGGWLREHLCGSPHEERHRGCSGRPGRRPPGACAAAPRSLRACWGWR